MDMLAHVDEPFLSTIHGAKGGTEQIDAATSSDILQRLPQLPETLPGGAAANTVIGLANLGTAAGFIGKVGEDANGDFYCNNLSSKGIRTDSVKRDAVLATGHCIALITPDSERTMRTFMGASAMLGPADLSPTDFQGHTHCLLEGYMLFNPELVLQACRLSHDAGLTVCMDVNSPEIIRKSRHLLPELLARHIDVLFANDVEAATLTGEDTPEACVQAIAECCSLAIVKLGRHGALIREHHSSETVKVPAFPVTAVDTTGAGDLWAAGFLHAWLHGASLLQAGTFGSHVAAEVVQVTGTTIPEDGWRRLKRLSPVSR